MTKKTVLDPITFEILGHRVAAINDEGASTLGMVTGSHVVNELHDFNTGLLNAEGEVVITGSYVMQHAISLQMVVKDILENYKDNPGINEDDMFICNDPYVGALHQFDVTFVSPIHWKGKLVGWAGCACHQMDLGGGVKGHINLNAKSIFEEGQVFPPVKIVEDGRIRADIEREYHRRSRLPELLGLDLRAALACNNVAKRRVRELIQERGIETILAVFDGMLDYAETRLRSRLKELPDGTWRHISYLDFDKLYPCKLAMTKKADELTFDFRGSAPQALGLVNGTYPLMWATVLQVLSSLVCYDMPTSTGGMARCVKIISEPGSVIHATWPAGVAKATTTALYLTTALANVCLSNMLLASEKYRDRAMAPWKIFSIGDEIYGDNQRGEPYIINVLDYLAGGAGARTYKDGIDTGGWLGAPGISISNIETYEMNWPLLFFYRRQEKDTGGPGKFRGGVGVATMYITHDVEEIPHKVIHCSGVQQPETVGIGGGCPGSTHFVRIQRNTNIRELMAKGVLPSGPDEIRAESLETPQFADTSFKKNDVFSASGQGGGGYGDPIERDPGLVLRDVTNELVSLESAADPYGVVIDPAKMQVDQPKTAARRAEIKKQRQSWKK